jgi:glycerate 2-kinase
VLSLAEEGTAVAIIGGFRRRMASSDPVLPAALASLGRRNEADLREHAEAILMRAVSAVDPENAVACSLRSAPPPLSADGRVWIVALGKAASAMARGASQALAGRVAGGMIAVPPGYPTAAPEPIRRFVAGHPVPDARSVEAATAALEIAGGASADDLVLALLSGGGSSVAALPNEGLRVEELAEATVQLIRAGAPSSDLAAVRKRLDGLKAGGLALRCARARGLMLAISDVPGDRLDLVASGPMSPDPTRIGEVRSILKRHGVWTELPLAVRGYLERCLAGEIAETPKAGHPCFSRIETRVVAGPKAAAEAALHEAKRLGYESQVLSSELFGDAREVGRLLGEMARTLAGKRRTDTLPQCVIATGATTLQGGPNDRAARNQELVLQGALEIEGVESAILASVGTDGTDGSVPAAGAVATGETVRRARGGGVDIGAALEEHDAYALFRMLRDLVVTGTTGTHVGDVQVLMLG